MKWAHRAGVALSVLATLFFTMDAVGKLLQIDPVVQGTLALGWPATAVIPLGVLLFVGAVLYAMPRTSVIGAIYLTAYLGGAVATHYRIGSPLATHVLFGVYVGFVMWGGLALRNPALRQVVLRGLSGTRRVGLAE